MQFQSENVRYNCENQLSTATIGIKQDCEEEDPLHIVDGLKQSVQTTDTYKDIQYKSVNIRYICEKCDKNFSTSYGLNQHTKKIHGHYNCKMCGQDVSQPDFELHFKYHFKNM